MNAHRFAVRVVFPEGIQSHEEATGAAEAIASKLPVGFEVTLLETWVAGAPFVPVAMAKNPHGEP